MILSQIALAEQIVILDKGSSDSRDLRVLIDPNAEIVLWSDLQKAPLSFSNISEYKSCLGKVVTVQDLEVSLQKADSSILYLEINKAIGHIHRIENDLVCLNETVPRSILAKTQFLLGVSYFYDEKEDLATESWAQALLFNPELDWDPNIEPSGKPAFEETKAEIKSQAQSRLILIPQTTHVTIDGQDVLNGTDINAGKHLVQHNKLNNQGHLISTEVGSDTFIVSFADFPKDLSSIMQNDTLRKELLNGLQIMQKEADIKIVENGQLWYRAVGINQWNSKYINEPGINFKPNKKLLVAGASTVLLGGGAMGLAINKHNQYMDANDADAEIIYATNRAAWFSATGLAVVGSGLLLMGTFQF